MKSKRLFGFVLIVCTIFLTFVPCHAQQYSPEFQALLNQIQQNYLAPRGDNLSSMRNQYPNVVAALIGHALRQQALHVQQNPSLNNRFASLQQQAQVYITDVARTTSSHVRNEDGSPVTPESLWFVVNKFYQGQEDAWIWQNFRVRTGTMPSVLATRSGPQTPRPPVWDPPMKEEENNQIDLLGQRAPSVKGPDSCDNVALYFSDQCKGYRQQKEAQAEAARQKSRALNPDGIAGTWFARQRKLQLKIWKQGDVYLGSISGETSWTYNFKPKEVCLRIKYVGAGKDGPVYKGQYYGTSGAAADYRWQDITFHYFLRSGKEVFSSSPIGSPALMDFER
mgnify:FL=1